MKGFPYVPWYHGDFLRSTAGWTLPERGAYQMLLCAQWESGPLPDDLTRLASIAGTDVNTMTIIWTVVGKKFAKVRGALLNKRMDEHRRKHLEFRRRQSEGGKKGMAHRYADASPTSNVIPLHQGKEPPRG